MPAAEAKMSEKDWEQMFPPLLVAWKIIGWMSVSICERNSLPASRAIGRARTVLSMPALAPIKVRVWVARIPSRCLGSDMHRREFMASDEKRASATEITEPFFTSLVIEWFAI
jgi:hypothetical protein